MKKFVTILFALSLLCSMTACSTKDNMENESQTSTTSKTEDQFILVNGGTFKMGSPESEVWRGQDEQEHTVTLHDFYISPYEVTQEEYKEIMKDNPSVFSGDHLPVENITWLEAIKFANAKSEKNGYTPVYKIEGSNVVWNRSADGYRLPTEAEWEYACRAKTTTPFHTETSIKDDEANYYGHYPYQIEENYFSQENLETKPGIYRETTIEVGSFKPNAYGLYDMHGNVSEWVWDYYGPYDLNEQTDPTGPDTGTLRIYRGGGWNDFAKNLRSAYRGTLPYDKKSSSVGMRLVRNTVAVSGSVSDTNKKEDTTNANGKVLIAYFSWSGNTKGIAEQIQEKTGADIFEITLVNPYSDDYNTVLDQAQEDQNKQARPKIANHIEHMDQYDTIILGYPNWWASIPMPIASFLEEYDFTNKTIIPFCSHGGGRFGQSLTAISKLVPESNLGEPLDVHYSGDRDLSDHIDQWLEANNIQ